MWKEFFMNYKTSRGGLTTQDGKRENWKKKQFYETYGLCSAVILGGINVNKLSTVQ